MGRRFPRLPDRNSIRVNYLLVLREEMLSEAREAVSAPWWEGDFLGAQMEEDVCGRQGNDYPINNQGAGV